MYASLLARSPPLNHNILARGLTRIPQRVLFRESEAGRPGFVVSPSLAGSTDMMSSTKADTGLYQKGCLSYSQDTVCYVEIEGNLTARIERVNRNIARIYLVDAEGNKQAVPSHITVKDLQGNAVKPFKDNFIITWMQGYTLYVDSQPYLHLSTQKQQLISAPKHAASGVM